MTSMRGNTNFIMVVVALLMFACMCSNNCVDDAIDIK